MTSSGSPYEITFENRAVIGIVLQPVRVQPFLVEVREVHPVDVPGVGRVEERPVVFEVRACQLDRRVLLADPPQFVEEHPEPVHTVVLRAVVRDVLDEMVR